MKGIKISKSILIVTALVSATGISIDTFSKKSNKQPAGTLYAYPGTNLRMMVDQTCGACHANKHFTTAGGFDLDSGAGLLAGGVLAQSLSIDTTTMVGNDPLTSLLIQKPLADSSMPHGGPKLDLNHPTIQALISYVQNGAPSAELDRPAQPPLSYYGASPDPLLVYVRSKQQPGGFRRVQRASSLPDVDGDIWLMRFQFNAVTQQNDILSNVNLTNFPDDQEVRNPSPSLDGSKICFSRRIPGNPWHIWEINSDGTGLRQITTGSHNQIQPFYLPYLPDGTEARAGEGGVGGVIIVTSILFSN
jgi:mono/diheme cytochrome c family protein